MEERTLHAGRPSTARELRLFQAGPSEGGYALVLHGGAGSRPRELSLEERGEYTEGLARAYRAGAAVLERHGSALDAVCATVAVLEDDPLFNAGRGAALTARGEAELDASVMTGDGAAGAVACSRFARNPVFAARKVMEETRHVLLVDPDEDLVAGWGLATTTPEYFVTEARLRQLAEVRSAQLPAPRHGTVGAVARDRRGKLAAATSTGGIVNQSEGRVGDTPILGAGTFARDGVVAVSCTGEGEAFVRGVVAHDVAARISYLRSGLAEAVTGTITTELTAREASGGLIAVAADGTIAVAHNSPAMFAAFDDGSRLVTLV
ncbi:isoaspartyl peptidase/L-asparaginase [Kitasatospora sp. RB6PN24]|uniref:isoaspartyl peptidase/L-asparaginase family protein n=1 Tax=Kitasatospora humi TaxID=2893891 RepID=UPI001E5ECF6E|nr:isoaspartyl peptidase/L-asparaginase [Kitasatospora humi]MCC9306167.1 isoaspartyl peptidase/L-asparaginase [Kitasatospora humi]